MDETVDRVFFETKRHITRPCTPNYPPQQVVNSMIYFVNFKLINLVLLACLIFDLFSLYVFGVQANDGGKGNFRSLLSLQGALHTPFIFIIIICISLINMVYDTLLMLAIESATFILIVLLDLLVS